VLAATLKGGALDDPPAARRFVERIDTEVDALVQMVDELLELSRIESGQVPVQLAPVSVPDLVLPAVGRLAEQAQRAGLELRSEVPEGLPRVLADAERIQQVLSNLIHNGIKFTPAGGTVTVSAGANGDEVTLAVRDTGVGIAPDILPRIFERFYRADRSRTGKGTGLGLAIAKHLVQAHGGRIWAESREGRGSVFYFTLRAAA
jgi:two-component system, OmpR family, phosphate regulon sensor histidine kinase PhoR